MNIINKLTFAYELNIVDEKMNGYKNTDFNLLTNIKSTWIPFIFSKSVPLHIGYNSMNKKNYTYVTMSIAGTLTEDQIKSLEAECKAFVTSQNLKILFPKIEKDFNFIDDVKTAPIIDNEKLRDHILLRSLTNTPDQLKSFERFSKSKLMMEHMLFMCKVNSLGIKSDKEYTFANLPIHDIDLSTNTLLIHKKVLPIYKSFCIAESMMNGNAPDTLMHELARLVMLDIPFSEFVNSLLVGTKPEEFDIHLPKIVKKAKSLIKKNNVPELYYNLMEEDLKELFGVETPA